MSQTLFLGKSGRLGTKLPCKRTSISPPSFSYNKIYIQRSEDSKEAKKMRWVKKADMDRNKAWAFLRGPLSPFEVSSQIYHPHSCCY